MQSNNNVIAVTKLTIHWHQVHERVACFVGLFCHILITKKIVNQ